MKKKELINNIKSKHIFDYIFEYIKEKTFQLKLFLYSKKFQKKFDINLIILKEKYLQKIKFELDKYLYVKPNLFKKDYLTIEYNNFLEARKLNKETIENIIYDIFENKKIKDIDEVDVDKKKEYGKLINIESPLFNILSKTKNFSIIFTIHISQIIIDEYKLKEDYIKCFDNLNKLDIKYESIFYILKDMYKINYLKEIKINFNKIKRLILKFENNDYKNDHALQNKIKYFYDTLFSFNNIKNNLIYLDINFINYDINNKLFKNINNFKLLRYLYLQNFNFKEIFIVKMHQLKLLSLISCKNIKVSFKINNEKLKELNLRYNNISNANILEKINFKGLNKIIHLKY